MATRKIKNAKDLVTDELIYFKSHAQATFMSDGTTVEDKINGLQNGGGVDLSKYVQKTELSSVATSGNYNDLSNKPTIPSAVTESTVSGWGFTKNAGTVTGVKVNGVTKNQSGGVVDLGYLNKQLSTTTSSSMTLSPNVYYRNTSTSLSTLTITLGGTTNNDIINEYFVEFTIRDAGTTVLLPNSIKWANGVAPTFENGKTYQISIVNNLGTCVKFG